MDFIIYTCSLLFQFKSHQAGLNKGFLISLIPFVVERNHITTMKNCMANSFFVFYVGSDQLTHFGELMFQYQSFNYCMS